MKIRTAEIPPTGIGWASQPSKTATITALFPNQPWVWTAKRSTYWADVNHEWVAVADLALAGQPPVHPRWVGDFVRGGVHAGLWQILPAGTRLRFVRRGVALDHHQQEVATLSLALGRGPMLRCSVAERGHNPDLQAPLWALLATALIAPIDDPLARGLASPDSIIERARAAAADALAAIRLTPDLKPTLAPTVT